MFSIKKFFERTKKRVELGLNEFTHVRPLGLTQDSSLRVQVMNIEACEKCGSVGEVDCVGYTIDDTKLIEHLEVSNSKIGPDIWYSGASGKAYCSNCIGIGKLLLENKS